MQQSAAALGDEEVRPAARSEVSIAPFGVAAESRAGRRMQGHEARLAKLGLSNRQNAVIQVDVVSLKTDCFGQTQPRHRNQPKQVMIGPSTESVSWRQGQGRRQLRVDLGIAVDIRLRALQGRQHPSRRHLCLRIDVRDVASKAAHVRQP
jgi:hypothetical protein